MKRLFIVFYRRNLAFLKLSIMSNLEYRLNYFTDAIFQPCLSVVVEMLLWFAVFRTASSSTINGFTQEYYLSYALWGGFFSRLAVSWMYEFRMIQEIDSGSINGLLLRPITFYECYLSQLMGYKLLTLVFSMVPPFIAAYFFNLPTEVHRLPVAFLLVIYYLVLIHSISFLIASSAFFLNKAYSISAAKNLFLWLLTGDLFPLDLMPAPYRDWIIHLPFSSAVYLPVGYITGRVDWGQMKTGFLSVTLGIVFVNILGSFLWKKGLQHYAGTGA